MRHVFECEVISPLSAVSVTGHFCLSGISIIKCAYEGSLRLSSQCRYWFKGDEEGSVPTNSTEFAELSDTRPHAIALSALLRGVEVSFIVR